MLEIIITIIGIAQGILAMLNKRINWLVYALQMILLVFFSYYNHLYGDMVQNALYVIFCIASWYVWKPGGKAEKITVISNYGRLGILLLVIFCTVFFGFILKETNDPLPFVDSFTTITTITALILMCARKLETWVVWFVNDISYMYQYFNIPDQALYLFGLYIIWTVLAIVSFINWRKIYKSYDKENCC